MNAEIIFTGFNLPDITDIPDTLAESGIRLTAITAVEPSALAVEDAVSASLTRAELILIIDPNRRSIGNTEADERVRAAVESVIGSPIAPKGWTSGFQVEFAGCSIIYIPSLPASGSEILPEGVAETFAARANLVQRRRVIRCFGLDEAQAIDAFINIAPVVSVQTASSPEGVDITLRVWADTPDAAIAILTAAGRMAVSRLGDDVYGHDGQRMQEAVASLLINKGYTVSTAESCTGGLVARRLTDVSGSSAYMERGVVTYSNLAKRELLSVPDETLIAFGAVSAQTAEAMAVGIRNLAKSDIGLSITGIAGPTGGTPEKPVGLVYIGLASPDGVAVNGYNFQGDREAVRFQTSQTALDLIRRYILTK